MESSSVSPTILQNVSQYFVLDAVTKEHNLIKSHNRLSLISKNVYNNALLYSWFLCI